MRKKFRSTLLTITILLWLGGYGYFVMMTSFALPQNKETKTDAIVVLTGGNFRTSTGLSLLAKGMAPELMITGVNKAVTEQDIRRLWHGKETLPECCITLGHEATTTMENAQEVQKWLLEKKFKTIRLVTSTYHMQRALLEFELLMPQYTFISHPVEEEDYSIHEMKFWLITFSEYNKYIVRSIILSLWKGFG